MPEPSSVSFAAILKYGWITLVGVLGYIWKNLTSQVEANSQALQTHVRDDAALHEEFVKKDDWHEFKNSMHSRFDKIEDKEDKILDKVINGVDRKEFKSEIGTIYSKLDSIEQRKADK